jgi:lysophospholipase L1-like esterase
MPRHSFKPLFSRYSLLCLGLLAAFAGTGVQAQPRPAPVPEVVKMAVPTPAEVEQVSNSLNAFLAGVDGETKQILQKFPALVALRAPGFNSAINPDLSVNFLPQHQSFVEIAKKGDIDVLFMGDSITDWWDSDREPYAGKPVFDKYFSNMKVANFGIAGDTTQGVLWRLRNGEGEGFSPKAIMLLIGVNNTRTNTAPEIAEGVGAVVMELQARFPDAKILLLGVFPYRQANDPMRKDIATINSVIARLHDGDRVNYLDISHVFLDANGNIPADVMSDALHPTTKGYELWAQAVIEPLNALLKP